MLCVTCRTPVKPEEAVWRNPLLGVPDPDGFPHHPACAPGIWTPWLRLISGFFVFFTLALGILIIWAGVMGLEVWVPGILDLAVFITSYLSYRRLV